MTAAEAFDYANRQVAAAFKSEVALATEHARIAGEDTAAFTVARFGASALSGSDPEVAALLAQRGEIELDLDGVKGRKAALTEDEYYDELEGVLVRLAQLQRQIDCEAGWCNEATDARSCFFSCSPRSRQVRAVCAIDRLRSAPRDRAARVRRSSASRSRRAGACLLFAAASIHRTLSCRPKPCGRSATCSARTSASAISCKLNARAVQPRVRWARLFLQTHQYDDAAELFRDALRIFPNDASRQARLGARASPSASKVRPGRCSKKCMREHDDLVEAHLLAARMALEDGQFEARRRRWIAPASSPRSRSCRRSKSSRCAPRWSLARSQIPTPWIKRALDYNPRYGAVYEQLAHFEIMRRRYREATALLQRAVEVQPDLWSAHAELGCEPAAAGRDRRSSRASHRPRIRAIRTARRPSTRCACSIASTSSTCRVRRRSRLPATPYRSAPAAASQVSRRCCDRTRSSSCSRASRPSRAATASSCRSR